MNSHTSENGVNIFSSTHELCEERKRLFEENKDLSLNPSSDFKEFSRQYNIIIENMKKISSIDNNILGRQFIIQKIQERFGFNPLYNEEITNTLTEIKETLN